MAGLIFPRVDLEQPEIDQLKNRVKELEDSYRHLLNYIDENFALTTYTEELIEQSKQLLNK